MIAIPHSQIKSRLTPVEKVVYEYIQYNKRITQREIALSQGFLGCHPIHEKDIGLSNPSETTLRKVRQIIRDIRIKHNAPILSDVKGYYIPTTREEVAEYLHRMERMAKSQAAAWHETYKCMKHNFDITIDFFEQTALEI